jgi:exonuclease SbcD
MSQQNLHVAGLYSDRNEPVVITDPDGPVQFHPIPYMEPAVIKEILGMEESIDHNMGMHAVTDRIARSFKPDGRYVAIAHAFITGGAGSDSERPLSIGGAETVDGSCFRKFHFTALGHLHQPQSTGTGEQKKKAGNHKIRYAGSLLKYSFLESHHNKTVSLIEMDRKGDITLEETALTPRHDVRCVEGYLEDLLSDAGNDQNREDYLMVTLKDKGAILDVMGKLRQAYPNVLHIERPQFKLDREVQSVEGDHRKINDRELFTAFFREMTGDRLSDDEQDVFIEQVNELRRRQRESQS